MGTGEWLPMVSTILSLFPGLTSTNFHITSPETRAYNCIAWAAGDTARWWWPDDDPENDSVYWPAEVERQETLAAFVTAFAMLGFLPCEGEGLESGFERIALFALADGTPTHAARQLPNGLWTSKLSTLEDIEHPLHAVSGAEYGSVAQVFKRPTLPTWSDEGVIAAAAAELPAEDGRRLSELLGRQAAGALTEPERTELAALMGIYQEGLVRKAQALREAVRRGLRGPLRP